jgi:flagellar biosynthesis protein FlhF
MAIKQFAAASIREAIAVVKAELGPDAVIVSLRSRKDKNGKSIIEVSASEQRAAPAGESEAAAAPLLGATPATDYGAIMTELQTIARRLEEIQHALRAPELSDKLRGFAAGIDELQRLTLEASGRGREGLLHDGPLANLYEKLRGGGVSEPLAQDVIESASRRLSSRALSPTIYGLECVAASLMERVRTIAPLAPGRGQQIHMFVGPTGVGKTTTIAKLAAQQIFEFGRSAALLTVDTFRVGAVDQLRTYARLLDAPVEVCLGEVELVEAVRRHADKDVLLVDTAGANQKDARMMGELAKFQQAGGPMNVHLIVAATTTETDLLDVAQRYGVLPLSSLVVSKLDEANSFGNVYNLMQWTRLPCSYFTVGQNVPEDIEPATPERLADLLLNVAAAA